MCISVENVKFTSTFVSETLLFLLRYYREGNVACMVEKRNAYRILVGKPEGKRLQGRPRYRWVDNVKMDLREIGWGTVDWIDEA
jgi:hypothetical protein